MYKSGYTYKLEFKPPQRASSQNPPESIPENNLVQSAKSNIGREFLRLIDKCVLLATKLRKIFHRNSLKLSQSCMPKVQQIIKGHNKTVLKNSAQQDQAGRTCICRKKEECPLEGNCLSKGIVYQDKVRSDSKAQTYGGLAAKGF